MVDMNSWHGSDKRAHAYGGAAIGSVVTLATNQWEYGALAGCAAGMFKEMHDARHPRHHDSSFQDFAVTCLGAVVGSSLTGLLIAPNYIGYRWTF